MKVITVFSAAVVFLMAVVRCDGDDQPMATEASPVRKTGSLTKAEYLHKAYVLGEGIRPPEGYTGTWRTWHENGNPKSERSLVNGGAHGPTKQWDTQGKRIATGEYRHGEPFEGSFRQWYYVDGKHCYAIDSYSSGRRHGPHSEWTVAGQKFAEGQFADDKRTGHWRWWDLNGTPIAAGTYKDGRPWSGSFASREDNRWRVQRYENGTDLQLRALEEASVSELSQVVRDRTEFDSYRWKATRELARRRVASSTPILIELLKDEYHAVRGSASWGLCQIGGQDAQDALLEYLRWSLTCPKWGDLARATEAQKELPDKRALDLLIKCLNDYSRRNAAEALGKIGDPKASYPLAQQLNLSIGYSMSLDYLYLDAIRKTKGRKATPILIEYLDRLVTKMAGQSLKEHPMRSGLKEYPMRPGPGWGDRQVRHNFWVYGLTLSALEAVTGRKTSTGSREDVAKDWKKWWKDKPSEQPDEPYKQ